MAEQKQEQGQDILKMNKFQFADAISKDPEDLNRIKEHAFHNNMTYDQAVGHTFNNLQLISHRGKKEASAPPLKEEKPKGTFVGTTHIVNHKILSQSPEQLKTLWHLDLKVKGQPESKVTLTTIFNVKSKSVRVYGTGVSDSVTKHFKDVTIECGKIYKSKTDPHPDPHNKRLLDGYYWFEYGEAATTTKDGQPIYELVLVMGGIYNLIGKHPFYSISEKMQVYPN